MCIHWVSSQASSLFSPVTQDMAVDSAFRCSDIFLPSTPNPAPCECDVLVIELSEAENSFHLDGLKDFFQRSRCSLALVLAPNSSEHHAIACLNAGADRCMPRDSDIVLIRAMIRSMLHRCHGQVATYTEHGFLRFEHDTRTLFHQSQQVPLTQRESLVAGLLFGQTKRHVRHEEILGLLQAEGKRNVNSALVSLYVHRINKKIRPYGVHIGFKRGYGYKLREDVQPHSPSASVPWLRPWPVSGPYASLAKSGQGFFKHA